MTHSSYHFRICDTSPNVSNVFVVGCEKSCSEHFYQQRLLHNKYLYTHMLKKNCSRGENLQIFSASQPSTKALETHRYGDLCHICENEK